MNNYIFKYNKKGDLYQYFELDCKNNVLSYYNLENNKLIRYDYVNKMKHFIKYYDGQDIIILQRFEAGESWVTITLRPKVKKIELEEIELNKECYAEYKHENHYHWMNVDKTEIHNLYNTIFPTKEKEYIFEKDKIYKFKVNKEKVEKWKNIIGFKETKRTYPHIKFNIKK